MMSEEIQGISLLDNIKLYLEVGETGYDILKRLKIKAMDTTTLALITGIPLFILMGKLSRLHKKEFVTFEKVEKLGEKIYKITKKGKELISHLKSMYI